MDYLQMLCEKNPQKEALVVDGISYTYGELVYRAIALGKSWKNKEESGLSACVHVIKEKDILSQLVSFFACYAAEEIPLLVSSDNRTFVNGQKLRDISIPRKACMAVATSGTTGEAKIYFRSYESWAGYFPVQNEIFQVTENSRMFVQGSLAFTGNLNLYLAQFFAGGVIVAENEFLPKQWERRMKEQEVNSIYLIPAKLLLIPKLFKKENRNIRMILSGSQSLGKEDARNLKKIFPESRILLYYGASELNYISYVTDENMTEERNLIGKPFPQVGVQIQNGEIYVDTKYHAEGLVCPYSLSDRGYQDEDGNLYFLGRKDDMLNIRGRKVSALRIENELEKLPEIAEAAVLMEADERKKEEKLVAYVVAEQTKPDEETICRKLRLSLERYEMPRRIYFRESLPKNESGKVDKKRMYVLQ